MKRYDVETAHGTYQGCRYELAMRTCATAIKSGNSPYAFMYDSKTQELINEFFHADIKINRVST